MSPERKGFTVQEDWAGFRELGVRSFAFRVLLSTHCGYRRREVDGPFDRDIIWSRRPPCVRASLTIGNGRPHL